MEFVFVVKRHELFDLHYPQGFLGAMTHRDEIERYLKRSRERGFFVERRFAELDSSMKQVIPYVVITRGDDVLLLKRTKQGGDARLHDKFSVGVGGHINPPDAEGGDPIAAATRREIDEEILLDAPVASLAIEPLGFINDDSNPVGSVHVGLACAAEVTGDVRVRETEMLVARFVSLSELTRLAADPAIELESWSRFLVPALVARRAGRRPA